MNINGKVALITGASSGIGAATALKLAAAGAKVGIAARRADRLHALRAEIVEKGGDAVVLEMDVTDPAAIERGMETLIGSYGSIDILFNNAGVMPVSEIDRFKTDEWNAMVDINIKGVLNTTAAVLPHMVRQHSGHIFNTSSIAGRKVFGPGFTVYSATKFAVTAFSEGLRMEIGKKHNIRVTCIQPGGVMTELPEQTTDPEKRKLLDDHRTAIRFLDPEDIADALVFAAQAPAHVNLAELFVMPIEQI
jgi:NADP-dependent 3-hydroxy acid dehydrogenase YdfG